MNYDDFCLVEFILSGGTLYDVIDGTIDRGVSPIGAVKYVKNELEVAIYTFKLLVGAEDAILLAENKNYKILTSQLDTITKALEAILASNKG